MFVDIHELELHPVDFAEEFAPGVLDLGADYTQRTPSRPRDELSWFQNIMASMRGCWTSGCTGTSPRPWR